MREILMCTGGVSQSACYERIQTAEMKLPTKICRPHKFVECTKIYKYPRRPPTNKTLSNFSKSSSDLHFVKVPSEAHVPFW